MAKAFLPRAGYVHSLDGIRFFAVFMVLLKHVGLGASSTFAPLRIVGTMAKAGTGVPLFFVVSGYLITSILFETRDGHHRYRNFLARRSLRIFPLYFGYLLAAILVTFAVQDHPIQHVWIYLLYLQSSVPRLASLCNSSFPLYHLWTLGVQEQFYLFWPLTIWACKDFRQIRKLCWIVVAGSFLVRLYIASHYDGVLAEQLMPCRAGEMALGGLFAMEVHERSWLSAIGPRLLWVVAPLCAAMILFRVQDTSFGTFVLHEAIALFATALLASALDPATLTAKILGTPLLAETGRKYSYGLFVFHPLMIVATNRFLHLQSHNMVDGVVRVVVTVASSILLAKLSYLYFERHCLHLKRFFPAVRRQEPQSRPFPVLLPVHAVLPIFD